MLHYSAFEQYFFEKILRMIILTKFLAGIFMTERAAKGCKDK